MKKTIITLTKDKLVIELINSRVSEQVLLREVFDWEKETLLENISQALSVADERKSFRLLLTESFFFIAGFTLPKKYEQDREKIRKKAEEVIPENLENILWDYISTKRDEKTINIQCFSLTKTFDKLIKNIAKDLPVQIEAIEPYPISIYRSFADNNPTFLLLYKDDITSLSMLVKDGLVVFSKEFNFNKFDEEVLKLLEFSKKFYEFKIPKIVLAGVKKDLAKSFEEKTEVIEVDIIASTNLTEKKDIKGKDQKVLNLQIRRKYVAPKTAEENQVPSEINNYDNIIFIAALVMISIAGLVIGFLVIKLVKG